MRHDMTSLGGNLYARKEVGAREYLTLFGPLGQERGQFSLTDQQAWKLFQILLDDIERLAAAQPADALEDEQVQIIALHQVHKALAYAYADQSVEEVAWTGDFEAMRVAVSQGSQAAETLRKDVENWKVPILDLILAVDDAALLLDDASEPEEKNQPGGNTLG